MQRVSKAPQQATGTIKEEMPELSELGEAAYRETKDKDWWPGFLEDSGEAKEEKHFLHKLGRLLSAPNRGPTQPSPADIDRFLVLARRLFRLTFLATRLPPGAAEELRQARPSVANYLARLAAARRRLMEAWIDKLGPATMSSVVTKRGREAFLGVLADWTLYARWMWLRDQTRSRYPVQARASHDVFQALAEAADLDDMPAILEEHDLPLADLVRDVLNSPRHVERYQFVRGTGTGAAGPAGSSVSPSPLVFRSADAESKEPPASG